MIQKAKNIIHQAISNKGICASAIPADNYDRIWSRDSMMTGIAGALHQDTHIIEAWRQSIITLADHQSTEGIIPSNVGDAPSYGSLVGRVDATLWWLIGTLLYAKWIDASLLARLENKIQKAFQVLPYWEYNHRKLIYTPMGGNWADEYLVQGYTLYDNTLRVWAHELGHSLLGIPFSDYRNSVIQNFNAQPDDPNLLIHPIAHQGLKEIDLHYLPASLNSDGYQSYYDMAGNSFAILLNLNLQPQKLVHFLSVNCANMNSFLHPVHYPIINEGDPQWNTLLKNFNYEFKNNPNAFHNGGAWPIFLGWLVYSLRINDLGNELADSIVRDYEKLLDNDPDFHEYIHTKTLLPGGKKKLCFSAAGYLLMKNTNIKLKMI